ncbi:hypothetical protein [Herbidospora sp. NBRC 101105]|uniref:hypothetical protein n=1 Tax=Herbidospora sp. NBRC 101105 TaxID=3032195 RepID=UPI0024A2139B|nr:hypothetical protein [Herbidospora sp. NBRC 101105]GLX97796.1 hypothetical protein Hesp01_57460 [Herbidospora sp. NBRC 101105]
MKRILPLLLLAASCPAPASTYACNGEPVPLAALTGPPATRLGADGQAALKGTEVRAPADLEDWHIVEESSDRVALIREIEKPVPADLGDSTHQYLLIERFGANDGWHLRRSTRCSLHRVFPGLDDADLTFGSSSGTHLNLLVTERGCASGQPAAGRVELVELEETDQEVRVAVAVRPKHGGATCQGNPPTPFTVELSRTLGDRSVVNVGVHPARRL